jgi:tRNA pseudouridine38-40 synthase
MRRRTVTLRDLTVCGLVAYDGTGYNGFQVQVGVPTIQGTLEGALARCAEPLGRVAGAGRTDTGVHATGQVVSVQVRWRHDLQALQRAWNAHLPHDITLRRLVEAPPTFHPRFSAVQRTYRYLVVEGDGESRGRSPLTDRFALYVPHALDLPAMQAAMQHIVGEHDFATFGLPTTGEKSVRRVDLAEWQVLEESPPLDNDAVARRLVFTIRANGFLRNMVRCLVGAALAVGRGDWSPAEVAAALAARSRGRTAPPAPAHGLVLTQVAYPAAVNPWGVR